jgi:MHS family proline/betaine transporter-like MFS transporter
MDSPLFWLMHHPDPMLAVVGQCVLAVLIGASSVSRRLTWPKCFRAACVERRSRSRTTSASACWGAETPLTALWLMHLRFMHLDVDALTPSYLLMAAAAVALLVVFRLPETFRSPLLATHG